MPSSNREVYTVTQSQMASGDLLNNRLGCQGSLGPGSVGNLETVALTLEYFPANTFNYLLVSFLI